MTKKSRKGYMDQDGWHEGDPPTLPSEYSDWWNQNGGSSAEGSHVIQTDARDEKDGDSYVSAINTLLGNAYDLGSNGTSSQNIIAILQSVLSNTNDADRRQEVFNNLVSLLQNLETRDYNKQQQLEQRAYDRSLQLDERSYTSESAQLSRLMALGMSRSAALQLIQGGEAGTNANLGSPISASSTSASNGLSPSQSTLNSVNTVGSAISSLSQLASLAFTGLSIPQVVAMNQIATNQALASNLQTQGIQDAGLFGSALFNSPVRPGYEDLISLDTLTAWAEKQTMETNPQMAQFVQSDAYQRMKGNPFAYPSFISMYKGYMSTKQWKEQEEDVLRISRMRQLEEKGAQLKYDADFLNYQWKDVEFKDFSDRHEIINNYTMMEYKDKLDILLAARTPDQLHYRLEKLKNDNEFAAISSWINLQTENYKKGMYEDSPAIQQLLYTSYLLNELGVNGILGNSIKLAAFATTPVAMFADSAGNVAEEVYDNVSPKVADAARKGYKKGKVYFNDAKDWINEQVERAWDYSKKYNKHAFTIFPPLEVLQ